MQLRSGSLLGCLLCIDRPLVHPLSYSRYLFLLEWWMTNKKASLKMVRWSGSSEATHKDMRSGLRLLHSTLHANCLCKYTFKHVLIKLINVSAHRYNQLFQQTGHRSEQSLLKNRSAIKTIGITHIMLNAFPDWGTLTLNERLHYRFITARRVREAAARGFMCGLSLYFPERACRSLN